MINSASMPSIIQGSTLIQPPYAVSQILAATAAAPPSKDSTNSHIQDNQNTILPLHFASYS
jgi:hypothetical protein